MLEGDHGYYEEEWKLKEFLENIPENKKEEVEKLLRKPSYFGGSFDRDWDYNMGYRPQQILRGLGFELINSDY